MSDLRVMNISLIESIANPLEADPWRVGLTRGMVQLCLDENRLYGPEPPHPDEPDPMVHAARIAWFVINGIEEDMVEPIVLDMTGDGSWPCEDGNHRLAAAIWRGDESLTVCVMGEDRYDLSF